MADTTDVIRKGFVLICLLDHIRLHRHDSCVKLALDATSAHLVGLELELECEVSLLSAYHIECLVVRLYYF